MPTTTGIATEFIQFTRASNATVTDSDGLVKWAPNNLLLNSESFDAASWTKGSGVVGPPVVTANNVVAPNGTQTADRIAIPAVSGTNASSSLYQTPTQAFSTPHTAGVYLRGDVGGEVVWIGYTPDAVTYTSVQCTLTTSWQLFTVNYTTSASGTQYFLIGVDLRDASQSAKGAQTIYAWGASLYRSDLGGMQPNTSAYPLYNPTTPKNLLGYTEDVNSWTKSNVTVSTNVAVAYNGLQTADLVYPTTTGTARQAILSASGVANTPYTTAHYVKSAGFQWVALTSPQGSSYGVYFDVINGVKGAESAGCVGSITPVGNGWFRCSITQTVTGTTIYSGAALVDANSSTTATTSGTSGIYLWGAQLSDSASLDSYVPVYGAAVTSAAYYGPRRDFDGATLACKGLLVEEQRVNLLLYSAQFDNVTGWSVNDLTISPNVAATTAPDGTNTADKLVASNISSQQYVAANDFRSGTHTRSVYVKAAELTRVGITSFNGTSYFVNVLFDLTGSGSVVSGTGGVITPVGNGWFRCSVYATTATSTPFGIMQIRPARSTDTVGNTSGPFTSGDGVYIWGAQLEEASFATSYIPTGAATATRNADVASVSTQAFPYSASTGSLVVNYNYIGSSTLPYPIALDIGSAFTFFGVSHAANLLNSDQGSVSISPVLNATGLNKVASAYAANDRAVSANSNSANTSASSYTPGTATTLSIGSLANSASYRMNGHIRQITYLPRRISNSELVTRST